MEDFLPVIHRKGLYRVRKRIRESDLLIISDLPEAVGKALQSVIYHRSRLEAYIQGHPDFSLTLDPIVVGDDAPLIVRRAAEASRLAGVGPMAAIPGALADLAVEDMKVLGARVAVVENGGEIYAESEEELVVGIYMGSNPLSSRLGFHLTSKDYPIGIGTSSATVSHALSLGEADAVIVISDSASMADAFATALCNQVRGKDVEGSVEKGLRRAKEIPQIRGALIARGDYIGTIGHLPRILKITGGPKKLLEAGLYPLYRES